MSLIGRSVILVIIFVKTSKTDIIVSIDRTSDDTSDNVCRELQNRLYCLPVTVYSV